jgi:hypothetical protein
MTWRAISARSYPSVLFQALGAEIVKQMAGEGDMEAQWSQGWGLVGAADNDAGASQLGASGRSLQADVGLALRAEKFPFSTH